MEFFRLLELFRCNLLDPFFLFVKGNFWQQDESFLRFSGNFLLSRESEDESHFSLYALHLLWPMIETFIHASLPISLTLHSPNFAEKISLNFFLHSYFWKIFIVCKIIFLEQMWKLGFAVIFFKSYFSSPLAFEKYLGFEVSLSMSSC